MKIKTRNGSSSGAGNRAAMMKPVVSMVSPAVLIFGLILSATAGDQNFSSGNLVPPVSPSNGASAGAFLSAAVERPPVSSPDSANLLRLDFRNAPLDAVLNYYSDAGGFIIMLETHTDGTLTVVSAQPVNRDEAVNLLNTALNLIGCAAVREGRQLTIVDQQEVPNSNLSVKTGNDPAAMPKTDEMATWIIPVRFIEAGPLVKDLSSSVSAQATIVANEAGNAIVVTDTQSHIRHLATIIQAMDNSAEAETEIRVFNLNFANPSDVETELNSIFQNDTSPSSGTQSLAEFAGGGDNFDAAPDDGNANSSQQSRVQRATQVTAVADSRLQAVIVSAPKFLMAQIASIMDSLDVASERDQSVFVYHLNNGDPNQVVSVLQDLFQSSGSSGSTSSSSQKSALQQRALNSATTMSSTTTTTTSTASGTAGGGNNAGGGAAGGNAGAR